MAAPIDARRDNCIFRVVRLRRFLQNVRDNHSARDNSRPPLPAPSLDRATGFPRGLRPALEPDARGESRAFCRRHVREQVVQVVARQPPAFVHRRLQFQDVVLVLARLLFGVRQVPLYGVLRPRDQFDGGFDVARFDDDGRQPVLVDEVSVARDAFEPGLVERGVDQSQAQSIRARALHRKFEFAGGLVGVREGVDPRIPRRAAFF